MLLNVEEMIPEFIDFMLYSMGDQQKNIRVLTMKCQLYMVSKISSCKLSSWVSKKVQS